MLDDLHTAVPIAMWDFSWLERRWPGGGYEEPGRALDELAERGYQAVRIDAFPHLFAAGRTREWALEPVWDQHPWGAPGPVTVRVEPALTEFIGLCAERNIRVALSTWFRRDRTDARMDIRSGEDIARVWADVVDALTQAGLADSLLYIDLCNEWVNPHWAPFLYPEGTGASSSLSRESALVRRWTDEALTAFKRACPQLPVTFSAADELSTWQRQDVSRYDFLEPHIWMAAEPAGFYGEIGYDLERSLFDPAQYEVLAERAEKAYRADPGRWQRVLADRVDDAAAWSRATGKPLITTECWAVVCYKDYPGLDWGWIKELCEFGLTRAAASGRWVALATSNFCGPQYEGMWSAVAWHQHMTRLIGAAAVRTRGAEK